MLALCIIAFTTHHQAAELGKEQREVIQPAYLASKENELRGYIMLAKHAISHLYESGRTDEATLAEAKNILAKLSYGNDGYFFVYDLQGNMLMHPHKPELVGQNRWNYRDINGYPHVPDLIKRANEGGGFVRYAIEKPSLKKPALKLTYALPLWNWGWVLCSGIYLDDVEEVLAKVDSQVSGNNLDTMRWIGAIAFLGMVVIIFTGLMLNTRERRAGQEEERARVARELHDGICQRLVVVKLQIETAVIKLMEMPGQFAPAQITFERMAAELNNILGEVREIAYGLYPAILKDLGLAASLRQLAHDMQVAPAPIEFSVRGKTEGLPHSANVALYRVAQEVLTNIKRHAAATQVSMRLEGNAHCVKLTIHDNGAGFDVERINGNPKHGMGLKNMRNRMKEAGGDLYLASSSGDTTIIVTIPRSLLQKFFPS